MASKFLLVHLRPVSIGELAPDDVAEIREHLKECSSILDKHERAFSAHRSAVEPMVSPIDTFHFRYMVRLFRPEDFVFLAKGAGRWPALQLRFWRWIAFWFFWWTTVVGILSHAHASRHAIIQDGLYREAFRKYGVALLRMVQLAVAGAFLRHAAVGSRLKEIEVALSAPIYSSV